nr:protein plastid movement impaired 1-related 1-like [Tanacetum cinerariifolium]
MSYVYHMSSPGYSVDGNSSPGMVKSPAKAPGQSHIKRGDNLSVSSHSFGRSVDDVKDLHEQEPVVGQFAADHSDKQTYGRRPQRYDIREPDPEYVSLEDLAPLAMNKIEALSIEGLRIQVNFDGSLGLEGTGGLQLLDVKNSSADEGDEMSKQTLKILDAHHASDLNRARRGKGSKKGGLLGNNFTVALMVHLRDPLRNFEPVGTLMLALNKPVENDEIKVEEKLVPVETKEAFIEEEINVEESMLVPQFKITKVHVAGVKTKPVPSKKPLWGSSTKQQQVGS